MTISNINLYIGNQIRFHRVRQGLTLREVGEDTGIRYKQISKYENAENGISASILYTLAKGLNVPVSFLYPP